MARDQLRERLDAALERVRSDPDLRRRAIADPNGTLAELGLADVSALEVVAESWGIGPSADCGSDTCRLTSPCGWTVCGKTTSSCFDEEDGLRARADELLERANADGRFRQELVTDPLPVLESIGLDPWSARGVAESWGIGPSGDCGSDTCRLTSPCGWTVCGKTTSSCADGEGSA